MAQKFDVCVLGATGLVGKTIIEILEQRKFPVNKLSLHNNCGTTRQPITQ